MWLVPLSLFQHSKQYSAIYHHPYYFTSYALQLQCIFYLFLDINLKQYKRIARCKFVSKFQIPSIPSTTNKTIRFPNDIIEQVENAIQGKDCTFSAFVIAAVRAALDDLDE